MREVTLGDVSEEELLGRILPVFGASPAAVVGVGDDTALLRDTGPVLATTDALVRLIDWRDEWSSGADVGAKAVAQNVADIAAMGGVCTVLLVTLAADPATPVGWVEDLTRGMAETAAQAGVSVVGGDLSSAGPGSVMVSVTALGRLDGTAPVLRSGARAGDLVAVAGSLGRSAAGLELLRSGRPEADPSLVDFHRRPRPPYAQGPAGAHAGATAMIDLSDGLLRDSGRVARASGVRIDLEGEGLAADVAALEQAVGTALARRCVLSGGEEHSLLACYPPGAGLPLGWRIVGKVEPRRSEDGSVPWVTVDGAAVADHLGWDHFAG